MNRDLEGSDAGAGLRRGLLQGHFAELQHLDGLPLCGRQVGNRVPQRLRVTVYLTWGVILLFGKGYSQVVDLKLVCSFRE